MTRIWTIIRDNYSTFYDYRTGKRDAVWQRLVGFLAAAGALAALPYGARADFLGGVITVQAILIGFSFSVMFFLVQLENKKETDADASIESEVRSRQISTLSKEIFWNVSYFNLVALLSLSSALILLLPDGWMFIEDLSKRTLNLPGTADPFFDRASAVGRYAVNGVFFFLLIDSAFTFARTVGRVNFLFEEKMPSA